jgi:membrane fusion protein, multidrug efflux system
MSMSVPARLSAALLALLPMLAGCGNDQHQTKAAPPAPSVTVAKPVGRTLVDQDEYVGRFVAVDSVEVRARVSGYLAAIRFQDGQMVRKGDLLFTIDRRPFEIVLDQTRANLAQARANLAYAESDLARGLHLVRDKTITEQTFDQRLQAKKVAEAAVAANEAIVRQAELDYAEFSELRAPVGGRIGDRRVSVGNLVTGGTGGNTTLLATIMSLDPIRFEFTFDEASFLRYMRSGAGTEMASRNVSTPVRLKLLDEESFAHEGRMDFVDNAITQSSGTIRGRAVFDNAAELFTPGMFGRVQVPGSPPYEALLVPDAAVGTEQTRKFVLVVDAENVARLKYVTLGQAVGDLRVIKQGLSADDRVIVNGLMRARQGAKVTPQDQGAPPPSPGPSAKAS